MASLPTVPATILPSASPSPSRTPNSSPTDPLSGQFTPGGKMPAARQDHVAVMLHDGRVFMIGGSDLSCGNGVKADIYNASNHEFTQTPATGACRPWDRAIVLLNGDVLIDSDGTPQPMRAYVYHPATNSFTPTGAMGAPRRHPTTILLKDGRVLVAGGQTCPGVTESGCVGVAEAQLYDPATGKFTPVGSMQVGRFGHTATLLADGRVLMMGGIAADSSALALDSAEVFDPASRKFSLVGSMGEPRIYHTATLLADGRVLVTGGQNGLSQSTSGSLASAELFDPHANTFQGTSWMWQQRQNHTATLLRDGRVLVAGGGTDVAQVAEIYDPAASEFVWTGALIQGRMMHTATLLNDGNVLIAGGYDGSSLDSCELFRP